MVEFAARISEELTDNQITESGILLEFYKSYFELDYLS
jgi:hypothetical protein